MNPEMHLDSLIEKREAGENQLSISNDEIAAGLVAAETLTQLQKIGVPPGFAQRLEVSIRARTRVQRVLQQNRQDITPGSLRGPANPHHLIKRRVLAALGTAAVLLLAFTSLLTVSASTLPGDPLYSLKQTENQFTLTFATDPQDRASNEIGQLHSALLDLSAAVNEGRDDNAIKQALATVTARTDGGQKAVAMLPAGSERETAQQNLDRALAEEDQTLRSLLNHVDWPMRLAFTAQLGVLGDPVPTITHVSIRTQSNGTFLITLMGTGFAPQALLIIDRRAMGTVIQNTSQQLVTVISSAKWSPGPHTFGVLNPDGTAAQMVLGDDGSWHTPQGDDHSNYGTPTPQGTRGPSNDN